MEQQEPVTVIGTWMLSIFPGPTAAMEISPAEFFDFRQREKEKGPVAGISNTTCPFLKT